MTESHWPDEQLVTAAQRGDITSLAALIAGSHANVRRFARSLCATPEDAEDAAQEALIILYRKIGMLRAAGALGGWMFRIVRNECLRRARTLTRDHMPPQDSTVPSAEHEALRRLEAGRVATAIAALPADQRHVLVLRDIHGRSGRETADALGIGTAAMKSRLHRARTAVRHALSAAPDPTHGEDHDGDES